jgi:hypothetical protein
VACLRVGQLGLPRPSTVHASTTSQPQGACHNRSTSWRLFSYDTRSVPRESPSQTSPRMHSVATVRLIGWTIEASAEALRGPRPAFEGRPRPGWRCRPPAPRPPCTRDNGRAVGTPHLSGTCGDSCSRVAVLKWRQRDGTLAAEWPRAGRADSLAPVEPRAIRRVDRDPAGARVASIC